SPVITQPRQTIASYRPVRASVSATTGRSYTPGAHATPTDASGTPHLRSAPSAPCSSRRVMFSLKWPTATAMRRPAPSRVPRKPAPNLRLQLLQVKQVAKFVALRGQISIILRIRRHLDRHPAHNLDPVALETNAHP